MKKMKFAFLTMLLLALLSGCSSKSSSAKSSHSSSRSSQVSKKASTNLEASSKTNTSSSNTQTSSDSQTTNFDQLTTANRNKLYASWLENAQGKFIVYNADATTTYFVNAGKNGTKQYENGINNGGYAGISLANEKNSAKFIINSNSVSLYVPASTNSYDGDWSHLAWTLQETLTKTALIQKYYQASGSNQQIVITNAEAPN